MHITVTVGEEPWLVTVTAEHAENDQVTQFLQDLVNEVELQLGAKRFASNEVGERVSEKPRSFAGSSDLMFELRQKLPKIERTLAPYEGTQHGADSVQLNPHAHVSGTWSPVPIESVPYFPWFQSLQARVCEELSVASHAKNGDQLMIERQKMAEDLEQASILMTQVWFSLDPLNPVNELPQANVQSVYSGPNHGESIVRIAALGCWFGGVAAAAIAVLVMWGAENASKIIALSSAPTGSHGN